MSRGEEMKRFLFINAFLLVLFLLTSCFSIISAETELELNTNEKWTLDIEIIVPAYSSSLVVMGLQSDEVFEFKRMQENGIEVSWQQLEETEEGIPFRIHLEGEGFDKLNHYLGYQVVSHGAGENEGNIVFVHPSGSDFNYGSFQSSFKLKGKKILSTNGVQLNNSTTVWENPSGRLEAIIKPQSTSSLFLFVIVFGASLVIYGLVKGNQSKIPGLAPQRRVLVKESYRKSRVVLNYCPNCGSKIPENALFCPNCGQKF